VFLVNSRQGYFCCSLAKRGKPYCELTAAFLPSSLTKSNPFALVHLHQFTCVGLRYGRQMTKFRRFSRRSALPNFSNLAERNFRCAWKFPIKRVAGGFSYRPSLRPERKSNNALGILNLVAPSNHLTVQEYYPAVHQLRLSPSP
jgi:hypothetical protein